MPSNSDQPGDTAHTGTWRLVLAYDGTAFQGWQVQPGMRTVQGTLQAALHRIFGVEELPQGSGRTDTGVHAEGQVASLTLPVAIAPERLQRVLNRRLPPDLRVLSALPAAPGFHARAGVLSKRYEYRIFPRRGTQSMPAGELVCSPFLAPYAWDCRWPLDTHTMQQAAAAVVGTHDFTSFAAHDPDRASRAAAAGAEPNNVRIIHRSCWTERDGLLVYRVEGSGFLHHMVRNLVGTFVEVGRGRIAPPALPEILAARDRAAAGPTAPPQGLYLMHVTYAGDESAEEAR